MVLLFRLNGQKSMSFFFLRFWIVHGHSTVRHYLKNCQTCLLWEARACGQVMAPLPKCRVTPGFRAFSCTGVDYFGPIHFNRRLSGKLQRRRTPAHDIFVAGVRYTRTSLQTPTVERRVVCFPL